MGVYRMRGVSKATGLTESVTVGCDGMAAAHGLMQMSHRGVVCLWEQTKKGWVPHARLIRRENSRHETTN